MGNFSRDTFDKLNQYVGVRLQQGVPIVDADWNEMEDIRKYELEAFLKWYVGNGVPKGNDGFRVLPSNSTNDFIIQGGDGTADGIGRCLVDGRDVINRDNVNYAGQKLTNDLADKLQVPRLPPLTTPQNAERIDLVYLDVWEREVNSQEDPNLKNEKIGIETCVRRKREWVVRVIEGTEGSNTTPALPPPSFPLGHAFYPLASIKRQPNHAIITANQITDLRLTGLSAISYNDIQQITQDAFGSGYALDHDGQPNLKVSLRDAINALLRGDFPRMPEQKLADSDVNGIPRSFEDSNGDIWMFWHSGKSGNYDIWCKRYSRATASWENDLQLTTSASMDFIPFALEDRSGNVWVFWVSLRSGNYDIWYKYYTRSTATWSNDTQLTTDSSHDLACFVLEDNIGDLWVFLASSRSGNYDIWYKRYARSTATWGNDTQLTTDSGDDYQCFALKGSDGNIWVFWHSYRGGNYNIFCRQYLSTKATWSSETQLTFDSGYDQNPFASEDKDGNIWVFWQSNRTGSWAIWYRRYMRVTGEWGSDIQLTTDAAIDSPPFSLTDNAGDIWIFWSTNRSVTQDIRYKRHSHITASWGDEIAVNTDVNSGSTSPWALEDGQGDIWVFWRKDIPGTEQSEILCRKLITTI